MSRASLYFGIGALLCGVAGWAFFLWREYVLLWQ